MKKAPFLAALFLLASVTLLALVPQAWRGPFMPAVMDDPGHFLAFLTLSMVAVRLWPGRRMAVFFFLLSFGIALELLQLLSRTHRCSAADVGLDAMGILAGFVLVSRFSIHHAKSDTK